MTPEKKFLEAKAKNKKTRKKSSVEEVILNETPEEKLKRLHLDKTFYGSKNVIAGIDPSLTKTGVIVMDDQGKVIHEELIETKKLRSMERLYVIKKRITEILEEYKVTIVAIESYSYGSKGRSIFNLGELGGVLRLLLWEKKYKYYDVSPNSLKSFIADNGAADKEMMRAAVVRKYKLDIEDDNICDAFGLAKMVLRLGNEMTRFCEKGGAQILKKIRDKEGIDLK